LTFKHIFTIFCIFLTGWILWSGFQGKLWADVSTALRTPSLSFIDSNTIVAPMCLAEAVTAQTPTTSDSPSTSTVSQLQNSSSATVMAMATGYWLHEYQRFVGSLRKTGYQGHIILAVSPDLPSDAEEYLLSKQVTIKKVTYVNCSNPIWTEEEQLTHTDPHSKELVTCVHPYPSLKHRWARFPLLRDYLQDCATCTGPVLVTDMRDTIFQRDPFGPNAPVVPPNTLHVFEEFYSMRTTNWLVDWPVYDCKGIRFDEPMLCSGTTIGTRSAMLEYLRVMHVEMDEWMRDPKCCCFITNADDQTMHNYLFYTGKLNHIAVSVPNRMGLVHTVGHQCSMIFNNHVQAQRDLLQAKNESDAEAHVIKFDVEDDSHGWLGLQYGITDKEGYFVDFDGGRSFVVHQIDRCGLQYFDWLDQNNEKMYL